MTKFKKIKITESVFGDDRLYYDYKTKDVTSLELYQLNIPQKTLSIKQDFDMINLPGLESKHSLVFKNVKSIERLIEELKMLKNKVEAINDAKDKLDSYLK